MGSYSIRWKHSAARELRGLERDGIARLVRAVGALSDDPIPRAAESCAAAIGPIASASAIDRVVYSVLADTLVIEVVRLGHRRDVYRGLT